jgi:hypothetical protein
MVTPPQEAEGNPNKMRSNAVLLMNDYISVKREEPVTAMKIVKSTPSNFIPTTKPRSNTPS